MPRLQRVALSRGSIHHLALVPADGEDINAGLPCDLAGNPGKLGLERQGLNGYLQDVRVTKGYARYVTPFTPPGAMTLYE